MLARFQGSPLVGAPQQGLSVGFFPHHRQFVPGPGIILVWIAGMQRRTASFFARCRYGANASRMQQTHPRATRPEMPRSLPRVSRRRSPSEGRSNSTIRRR